MKTKKIIFSLLSLLLIIISTSRCNKVAEGIQPPGTITHPLPTLSPTRQIPPISPTSSIKPVIESTVKPFPTLLPQVTQQLLEILQTNGNCKLPCFIGIIPGKTTFDQAKSIIEKYSINKLRIGGYQSKNFPNHQITSGSIVADTLQSDNVWRSLTIILEVDQNRLVQNIMLDTEIFGDGWAEFHDKHMIKYGLREIFKQIGPPDEIYYWNKLGYTITIVYEKVKLLLTFSANYSYSGNGYYWICPNMGDGDTRSFRLILANPKGSMSVADILPYPIVDKTLYEATGLTVQEFYESVISDNQPACFNLKCGPESGCFKQ